MLGPNRAAASRCRKHSGRRLLARIRGSWKTDESGRPAQGWQGLEPVVVDRTSAAC
jgi:hypothetical protein